MEMRRNNHYTVNNVVTGAVHMFRVTYVSEGFVEVKVIASSMFSEGRQMELRKDGEWFLNCNWMLKKGLNPAYDAVTKLAAEQIEFLIDLALATRDFEWLKKLQYMEVAK